MPRLNGYCYAFFASITFKTLNISEGISRGQCNGKADSGLPGQVAPYAIQLLLSYLLDAHWSSVGDTCPFGLWPFSGLTNTDTYYVKRKKRLSTAYAITNL